MGVRTITLISQKTLDLNSHVIISITNDVIVFSSYKIELLHQYDSSCERIHRYAKKNIVMQKVHLLVFLHNKSSYIFPYKVE